FGFEMPEKPRFLTAFAIKRSYLMSHGWTAQRRSQVYQALLDQCERMRYGPRLLGSDPICSLENGLLKIDWSPVDDVLPSYFRRFDVSQIVPAQLGSHDKFVRWNSLLGMNYQGADDLEFQHVWVQFIQQYMTHFRQKGLLDKMLFIIWDEPYAPQYHDIRVAAEIVRREAPGLPIGLFIAQYAEALADYIDIWLVAEDGIADLCAKLPPGKRKWLYNSGGLNNFRIGAADMRGYYLLAFRQGIEGFLFSESNHVDLCLEKDGRFHNLYPQHCWCYVTQDGSKVYDSWRQLLVQSGIDDYDYLALLQEKQGSLPDWLTDILPGFREGRPDFRLRTAAEWNILRVRIAGLLENPTPKAP
ncbi:MAG: hypothetical protein IJJ33_09450, partial [Victivallales bacterium]|nr:hypothetical protein [Victivallales bacterium]